MQRAALDACDDLSVGDAPEPVPSPAAAPSPGYVSIADAARHFGVSARTVRRRVLSREWPSVRVGRQIRIDLSAVVSKRRRA